MAGPSRKSSIDLLDPRIQEAVNQAIKDNRATIDEIVDMIKDMGGDASRSAVGRYVRNQNQQLAKYREAQEVAKVWVDKLGKEPDGDVGRLIIEMLRVISFQTMSQMDSAEPEQLMFLGHAIKNIAQADKLLVDREASVRKMVAAQVEKVMAKAEQQAVSDGGVLTLDAVKKIRQEVYGIFDKK